MSSIPSTTLRRLSRLRIGASARKSNPSLSASSSGNTHARGRRKAGHKLGPVDLLAGLELLNLFSEVKSEADPLDDALDRAFPRP